MNRETSVARYEGFQHENGGVEVRDGTTRVNDESHDQVR